MIDTYPEAVLCFMTILNWITNNDNIKHYQLECVILKTVLEHPKYHNNNNTLKMINKLLDKMLGCIIRYDYKFIIGGIDYDEIKNELKIIGITSTKFIDQLELISSRYAEELGE